MPGSEYHHRTSYRNFNQICSLYSPFNRSTGLEDKGHWGDEQKTQYLYRLCFKHTSYSPDILSLASEHPLPGCQKCVAQVWFHFFNGVYRRSFLATKISLPIMDHCKLASNSTYSFWLFTNVEAPQKPSQCAANSICIIRSSNT